MYHLIYRSQTTEALDTAELTSLLEQSRAYNVSHAITGVLLYTSDHQCLQVLEGEKQAVRSLYYEHIVHDLRHQDCFVLSEGIWMPRRFSAWSMGFLSKQQSELSTKPGFVEITQLRRLLPLLAPAHPSLRQLLLEFVEQHEMIN